jgi:hypothetical protein
MRLVLAWLLGTAVFALGIVLADRWFWSQCSGLPTVRYAEVWTCSNAPWLRIAVVAAAGVAAGLLARRRGVLLGLLVGLSGVAAVSLLYRPLFAFTQVHGLMTALLHYIVPATIASLVGARRP